MCLHGLDPEGTGEGLMTTLAEEGYRYTFARSATGEANSIFWDPGRFELAVRRDLGGADLAVDLRPLEDPQVVLKIVCIKPEVPTSDAPGILRGLLSHGVEADVEPGSDVTPTEGLASSSRLVVSADLSLLGGAQCADVVEELVGLSSVAVRILGEELQTPLVVHSEEGFQQPARAPASGFVRLHRPDGMFFGRGLEPLLALSGHTEPYLVTMPSEDVMQQFPACRIPILAAFDWRKGLASTGTEVSAQGD